MKVLPNSFHLNGHTQMTTDLQVRIIQYSMMNGTTWKYYSALLI